MNRGGEKVGQGQAEQAWCVQRPVRPASWDAARGRLASGTRSLSAAHCPAGSVGSAQHDQSLGDLDSAPGSGTAWPGGLGKPLPSPALFSCL